MTGRAGIVAETGACGQDPVAAGTADTASVPVPVRSVSGLLPQVTVVGTTTIAVAGRGSTVPRTGILTSSVEDRE